MSLLLRCLTTVAELTNWAPQSGTGSRASTSSLNSLASGIDGPCWRRAMSGPAIPEELEDNADPGATGHPQEPEPWQVTSSVGLTLSNYSLTASPCVGCREEAYRIYVFARQLV